MTADLQELSGPGREPVDGLLASLRTDIPAIRRIMLATSDGLPVSVSGENYSEPHEAAMTASILALGAQVGTSIGGGEFADCTIRSTDSVVCVVAVSDQHVLAVSTDATVNLGLLLRQCRLTARQLSQLLARAQVLA